MLFVLKDNSFQIQPGKNKKGDKDNGNAAEINQKGWKRN